MTVNFIAVTFDEQSKAYQALSSLKGIDGQGGISVRSAAVVERDPTGRLQVPESSDTVEGEGLAAGSLAGMLVGILGGPIGMLLGLGAGALVGGAADLGRADSQDEVLAEFSRHVPAGGNALLAEIEEPQTRVVDEAMAALGGVVLRRSASDVLAEIEAAEQAAEEAAAQARKLARERKRAELHEKYEERKAQLREKLHIG